MGNPVVSGTVISSTWANAVLNDLATGLSTAVTRDGQSAWTANLPAGGFIVTGLGNGSAATDSINFGQAQTLYTGAGYTTTATAAGTTTLTVSSERNQYFTGATTQTVVLPVASTMRALGDAFRIVNNSSGAVTVNSSGGNLVATLVANTQATITCVLLSGTAAASWDVKFTGTTATTGTGSGVRATSPTLTTPDVGVATATSINKVAITAPASAATLTIANNKTLTANASLTLTGTDSTTMTFPTTTASVARTDASQTFTGAQTFSNGIILSSSTLSTFTDWTSFTPGLTFGGASTGIVYVLQTGAYCRIGNVCYFVIRIVLSNNGSATGGALITNIPFTVGAGVFPLSVIAGAGINLNSAGGYYTFSVYPDGGSTTLIPQQSGDNVAVAQLTDTEITDTADMRISGFFRI